MPFALPLCFSLSAAAYWGHRIRFKLVLFGKGVWRCLESVELKQHEFYAFLYYTLLNSSIVVNPPYCVAGSQCNYEESKNNPIGPLLG